MSEKAISPPRQHMPDNTNVRRLTCDMQGDQVRDYGLLAGNNCAGAIEAA
jgi:hypothetical protein